MNETKMPAFEPELEQDMDLGSMMQSMSELVRIGGTFVGIVIVIAGLVCMVMVISGFRDAIANPQGLEGGVMQWFSLIDGENLAFDFGGENQTHPGRLLATLMMGICALVLARLCIALMTTGAKVIMITSGDKEAVKRVLKHAFGEKIPVARKRTGRLP